MVYTVPEFVQPFTVTWHTGRRVQPELPTIRQRSSAALVAPQGSMIPTRARACLQQIDGLESLTSITHRHIDIDPLASCVLINSKMLSWRVILMAFIFQPQELPRTTKNPVLFEGPSSQGVFLKGCQVHLVVDDPRTILRRVRTQPQQRELHHIHDCPLLRAGFQTCFPKIFPMNEIVLPARLHQVPNT